MSMETPWGRPGGRAARRGGSHPASLCSPLSRPPSAVTLWATCRACARELAGMGATVVLAGRSATKLEASLARIK